MTEAITPRHHVAGFPNNLLLKIINCQCGDLVFCSLWSSTNWSKALVCYVRKGHVNGLKDTIHIINMSKDDQFHTPKVHYVVCLRHFSRNLLKFKCSHIHSLGQSKQWQPVLTHCHHFSTYKTSEDGNPVC